MAAVIDRVDRLENVVQDFVTSVGIEFNKLYNSQLRTEAEMRAFKADLPPAIWPNLASSPRRCWLPGICRFSVCSHAFEISELANSCFLS